MVEEEVTTGKVNPSLIADAPLDEQTKTYITIGLAFFLSASVLGGSFIFVKNVQERASAAAEYIFKVGGLAVVFFLLANFVLEK